MVRVVDACIGETRLADQDDGPCFLGVDPGRVIHYVIGKRLAVVGDRRLRDKRRRSAEGLTTRSQYLRVDSVPTWEALANLMSLFQVRMAVIDGAYDATKAKEFSHKFPKRVLLAYKGEVPEGEVYVPLGQARVVREVVTAE